MLTAEEIISIFNLKPHPNEGGFYAETYRSEESFGANALPSRYTATRSFGTAIYYLLTPETFSAMHRLPTDEVFHFYLGDPVEMLQLHPDGSANVLKLGTDLLSGQRPQVIVPKGVWQGSRLIAGGRFALLGATMAPGFDFADYETGKRSDLIAAFTKYEDFITALTSE
jgi:uncharacterized protein